MVFLICEEGCEDGLIIEADCLDKAVKEAKEQCEQCCNAFVIYEAKAVGRVEMAAHFVSAPL